MLEYHINTFFPAGGSYQYEIDVIQSFAQQGWHLVAVTNVLLPERVEGVTTFPPEVVIKHYFEREKVDHIV